MENDGSFAIFEDEICRLECSLPNVSYDININTKISILYERYLCYEEQTKRVESDLIAKLSPALQYDILMFILNKTGIVKLAHLNQYLCKKYYITKDMSEHARFAYNLFYAASIFEGWKRYYRTLLLTKKSIDNYNCV